MTYQSHSNKLRAVAEKEELDGRLKTLREFTATETFAGLDPADQRLIQSQIIAMDGYSSILRRRIERFMPAPADGDFPLGKACDLSGDAVCEACQ